MLLRISAYHAKMVCVNPEVNHERYDPMDRLGIEEHRYRSA